MPSLFRLNWLSLQFCWLEIHSNTIATWNELKMHVKWGKVYNKSIPRHNKYDYIFFINIYYLQFFLIKSCKYYIFHKISIVLWQSNVGNFHFFTGLIILIHDKLSYALCSHYQTINEDNLHWTYFLDPLPMFDKINKIQTSKLNYMYLFTTTLHCAPLPKWNVHMLFVVIFDVICICCTSLTQQYLTSRTF